MYSNGEDITQGGWQLPLAEAFYSIQGEGYHSGQAVYFIRLAGCSVRCHWCDSKETWNARNYPLVDINNLAAKASDALAPAVVVTGGEPTLYNLGPVSRIFREKGLQTYLESSGTGALTGQWDWICLSPKEQHPPGEAFYEKADELKVIIYERKDLQWARQAAGRVRPNTLLYLQPEWSRWPEMMPVIVDYVKEHPRWRVSLQAHKFMQVP